MKKALLPILLVSTILLTACGTKNTPAPAQDYAPAGSYAKGADLSWLTEMERDGILFYDTAGTASECMSMLRGIGMNSVRLRVWVNHSTGWCNPDEVLTKAIRARDLKLRVMVDFHYSDYFADPAKQNTPAAWQQMDIDSLETAMRQHTRDVLQMMADNAIRVEWVQIGNETRNGMLWPLGQLWNDQGDITGGWTRYARLTRAGYEAAKEVYPEAQVIVHIDNAYQDNRWFFTKMRENGGKFDMIGLSHYPMMKAWTGKEWQEMNQLAEQNIRSLYTTFGCPVMLCELGTKPQQDAIAQQVINDLRSRLDTLPYFRGIFYWEPECYGGWKPQEYTKDGWGAYDMGCFTSAGQPSSALVALWK